MKNSTKRFQIIIGLLAVVASMSPVIAQEKGDETINRFVTDVSGAGTTAAAFLEIGVGARAMAMGGAYTSVAKDVSALYWNPAGIVWIPGMSAGFTHSEWLAETSYDYVGIVVPIFAMNSAVGLSFSSLDYGEQPVRTVGQPEGTGEIYSARDFAIGLTYAAALTDRFSFGLSAKYIQQRIWSETGTAFGMDLGVFYNTMLKGLQLGASMSNFGSELKLSGRNLRTIKDPDETVHNYDRVPVDYKTASYPLPLFFRFGVSYERKFGAYNNVLVSADVIHPNNQTESINFGMEYGFADMFFLRGGYQSMYERDHISGLTAGGGVVYSIRGGMTFKVDYSWSDWGILDSTQRFTVGVTF